VLLDGMVEAYMRRKRWEAQLSAVALLEQLAAVLPKKSKSGKVSPDEFLKIAGQSWQ
jgi:hypothetical protein